MPNLLPRIEFGLQALVRRQRACPFCGGRDHRVVARKRGVLRIRRCADCHLYFTDPIYRSFVGDLLMPPIGLLLGNADFSNLFINLSGKDYPSVAAAKAAGAATLNYGMFFNNIINFLLRKHLNG